MEAKAEGMFQGLYGRLKNLATIPEKYNVAATMATSMLEYWVADNEKTSGEIINFLRTKGLPVQSFMCLNKLRMDGQMRERFVAPDQSHRIFDLLNITEPDVAAAFFKAFRNTLVSVYDAGLLFLFTANEI
jgi:chromosome segregation ATPase